jgi:hypothetical protein
MIKLEQSIANIDAYLDTWKDARYGIHGYVVAPENSVLSVITPDVFTQSHAILAHIKMFEITEDGKYLEKATKEAQYLVESFSWEVSSFYNACFEYKPGNGIFNHRIFDNALGCTALFKLCNILRLQGKDYHKFLYPAKRCMQELILNKSWAPARKVFLEQYGTRRVLVSRTNAAVIESLLELGELLGKKDTLIKNYCIPAADAIIGMQYKNGLFAREERGLIGSSLDSSFVMRGMLALLMETNDKYYLDSLRDCSEWFINHIDKKTRLFIYGQKGKHAILVPMLIAGATHIASQLTSLRKAGLKTPKMSRTLTSILRHQFKSGAIQTMSKFVPTKEAEVPKKHSKRRKKRSWSEVLPCPTWNALALYSLTNMLEPRSIIPYPSTILPCTYESREHIIKERMDEVIFYDTTGKNIVVKWHKQDPVWKFGCLEHPKMNTLVLTLKMIAKIEELKQRRVRKSVRVQRVRKVKKPPAEKKREQESTLFAPLRKLFAV